MFVVQLEKEATHTASSSTATRLQGCAIALGSLHGVQWYTGVVK